jgi:hypothetical protein
MARNLLIFILCATVAVLGYGYYESLRSGVLTVKGRTSRRNHEPISYWLGMILGAFVSLLTASGAALMAFFVFMDLFRR